jgi:pyruvate kinase
MVASAVVLANSLPNSKLVVFTRHGIMARYVSNMRPQRAPIFAFAPSEEVCRQLALSWGTCAIQTAFTNDPNKTIAAAEEFLGKNKLAAPGDQLVIVSDLRAGETLVDCVQLRTMN